MATPLYLFLCQRDSSSHQNFRLKGQISLRKYRIALLIRSGISEAVVFCALSIFHFLVINHTEMYSMVPRGITTYLSSFTFFFFSPWKLLSFRHGMNTETDRLDSEPESQWLDSFILIPFISLHLIFQQQDRILFFANKVIFARVKKICSSPLYSELPSTFCCWIQSQISIATKAGIS